MKQNSKGIFDYLKLEIIGFYLTGQRLNFLICPTVFSTHHRLNFYIFWFLCWFSDLHLKLISRHHSCGIMTSKTSKIEPFLNQNEIFMAGFSLEKLNWNKISPLVPQFIHRIHLIKQKIHLIGENHEHENYLFLSKRFL